VSRLPVPLVDRRLRVGLALLVVTAVFVASVVDPPGAGAPTRLFGLPADKLLHAVAYAGVAGAVGYAALDEHGLAPRALLAVFLLAASYGFGIELVQAPLPARAFDLLDAAANAVGAAVGTLPYLRLRGVPWPRSP
jgi:VanZ family protein